MLTEEHLKTIHNMVSEEIDSARKELEEDGGVTPRYLLFAHSPQGDLQVRYIMAPAMSQTPAGNARNALGDAIRLEAAEMGATACLSIQEVWMLKSTPDNPRPSAGWVDWSNHPDRKERVVVVLQVPGEASSASMPIIRAPGKPPTFTNEPQWETGQKVSGRLLGILPEPMENSS